MTDQFDFEDTFERRLLAFLVRDLEFFNRNSHAIRFDYFENQFCRDICEQAQDYVQKYGSAFPKDILRNEIQKMFFERKRQDVTIDEYWTFIDDLFAMDLSGEQYTEDEVLRFAQRQQMHKVLGDAIDRVTARQDLTPILADVTKAVEIGSKNLWEPLTREQVLAMKNPSPLFEGFNLYEGCFYLMTGSGGDFKSIVGLSIIQSILKEAPLFERFKTLQTGPVILIDEETPDPIFKHRMMNTGLIKFIGSGDLQVLHFKGFKIYDPKNDAWFNTLVRNADRIKPKIVVFDSLTRLHNEDEIKGPKGMAPVMDRFRDLSKLGYTSLLIHHFNKSEVKSARGSTDIPNASDGEYQCVKTGLNTLTFSPGSKTRNEMFEPLNLTVHGLMGLMVNSPIYVTCAGTVDEGLEKAVIKVLSEVKHGGLQISSKSYKVSTITKGLEDMGVQHTVAGLNKVVLSLVGSEVLESYLGAKPAKGGHAPTLFRLIKKEDEYED